MSNFIRGGQRRQSTGRDGRQRSAGFRVPLQLRLPYQAAAIFFVVFIFSSLFGGLERIASRAGVEVISTLGSLVLIAACLVIVISNVGRISQRGNLPALTMAMFIIVLSMLYHYVRGIVAPSITTSAIPTLSFLASYFIFLNSDNEGKTWFIPLCIASIVCSGITFLDFLGIGAFTNVEGRGAGLLGNPNVAACLLTGCSLCILAGLNRRDQTLGLVALAFTIFATVVTFSRSGIIVAFLIVVFFGYFRVFQSKKIAFLLSAVAVGLGLWFLANYAIHNFTLSPDAKIRIESLLGISRTDDSVSLRKALVKRSMVLIGDNPFGLGAGTGLALGPHNMFLRLALDFGVFVTFGYMALVASAARPPSRLSLPGGIQVLFLLWFAVWALTSHNLDTPTVYAILGFGFALPLTTSLRMVALREARH